MLEHGGNAVDAAVAANAAMGLFAPMANGIGGDLFAIVYEAKTGKLYGLNASGWAPAGLTPDFLKAKGFTNMPQAESIRLQFPALSMAGTSCCAVRTQTPLRGARADHSMRRSRVPCHRDFCELLGGQRTQTPPG
jgi:gamma-glutamyltranspeptidase/glutathione hydrolase